MKRIILLVACLAPLLGISQNNKGKVVYREELKFDMDLKLDGVENAEAIKAMLPKSQVSKKTLLFSQDASLYKNMEDESQGDNSFEESSGNVQMKVVIAKPENEFYRDLKNDVVIEKNDLFGKSFIIKEENAGGKGWKLVDEQKTILGYECRKAVMKDSAKVTEAWYAPAIPVSSGPMLFGKLPGLVLEINSDNGRLKISATDIKLGETQDIEPPKKGKQVTREEFKKIAEAKRKEMQESMGGRGNVIIRKGN